MVAISAVPVMVTLVIIARQPKSNAQLAFTVPLVPWLPGISILINIYLMTMLDVMTWVRFAIWIVIGFAIYFTYGISNSVEKTRVRQLKAQQSVKSHDSSELFTTSKDILVPTGQ